MGTQKGRRGQVRDRRTGRGGGKKNPPVCTVSRLCVGVFSEKYSL